MARDEYKSVRCSFCGKHQEQVDRIIAAMEKSGHLIEVKK